jgi:hypothetical protein
MVGISLSKHQTGVFKVLIMLGIFVGASGGQAQVTTGGTTATATTTTAPVVAPGAPTLPYPPYGSQVVGQAYCSSEKQTLLDKTGNLDKSCAAVGAGSNYTKCISTAAKCSRDMGVAEMDSSESCEDVVPSGCPSAAGKLYDGYKDEETAAREERSTAKSEKNEAQDQILAKRTEQMEKQQEVEKTITEKRNEQKKLVNEMEDKLLEIDRKHQERLLELKAKNAEIDNAQTKLNMDLQEALAKLRDKRLEIIIRCDNDAYAQRDANAQKKSSMKTGTNSSGRVYKDASVGQTSSKVVAARKFAARRAECMARNKVIFDALEQDSRRAVDNINKQHASLENQRKLLADAWMEMSKQIPQDKDRLAKRIAQMMQEMEQDIQMTAKHAQAAAINAQNEVAMLTQRQMDAEREFQEADARMKGARALAKCTKRFSGDFSEKLTAANDAQANFNMAKSACFMFDSKNCGQPPPVCAAINPSGGSRPPVVVPTGNADAPQGGG